MNASYDSDAAADAPAARRGADKAVEPHSWRGVYLWDEIARTLARIDLLDKRTSRLAFHYVDPATLAPTGQRGFMDCLEAMARRDYGALSLYPPEHPLDGAAGASGRRLTALAAGGSKVMKKVKLDTANLAAARDYLRRQMRTQSWWPREQPHVALEEFLRLQETPDSLQAWCDKWLDSGQWRQLAQALARASRPS